MEPLTASLMAIGTGAASGLRPYLTVLTLGLAGTFINPADAPGLVGTAVAQIPHTLTNPWVLVVCAILAIADGGLDKIFGLNLGIEALGQFVRPVFGVLVGYQLGMDGGTVAATAGATMGGLAAIPVSLGKGSLMAGLTAASPGPISQILRSLAEDFGALGLVVAAIVAPVIAAVLGVIAIVVGIALFITFRKALRAMRTKFSEGRARRAELKAIRAAQLASGERVGFGEALRRAAAGATPALASGYQGSVDGLRRAGAAGVAGATRAAAATVRTLQSAQQRVEAPRQAPEPSPDYGPRTVGAPGPAPTPPWQPHGGAAPQAQPGPAAEAMPWRPSAPPPPPAEPGPLPTEPGLQFPPPAQVPTAWPPPAQVPTAWPPPAQVPTAGPPAPPADSVRAAAERLRLASSAAGQAAGQLAGHAVAHLRDQVDRVLDAAAARPDAPGADGGPGQPGPLREQFGAPGDADSGSAAPSDQDGAGSPEDEPEPTADGR